MYMHDGLLARLWATSDNIAKLLLYRLRLIQVGLDIYGYKFSRLSERYRCRLNLANHSGVVKLHSMYM